MGRQRPSGADYGERVGGPQQRGWSPVGKTPASASTYSYTLPCLGEA